MLGEGWPGGWGSGWGLRAWAVGVAIGFVVYGRGGVAPGLAARRGRLWRGKAGGRAHRGLFSWGANGRLPCGGGSVGKGEDGRRAVPPRSPPPAPFWTRRCATGVWALRRWVGRLPTAAVTVAAAAGEVVYIFRSPPNWDCGLAFIIFPSRKQKHGVSRCCCPSRCMAAAAHQQMHVVAGWAVLLPVRPPQRRRRVW